MIEPTSLRTVPEVVETSPFEEFYLAEHERLFQALHVLTGELPHMNAQVREALP